MLAALRQTALALLFTFSVVGCQYNPHNTPDEKKNIKLVENMFSEMAEKMDAKKIDQFYSPDFIMVSNDTTMNFKQFKEYHENAFRKRRSLSVKKPFDDIFAKDQKVVGRTKITLEALNGKKDTFDVMFIALIEDHKIKRLWEVTYPGWKGK